MYILKINIIKLNKLFNYIFKYSISLLKKYRKYKYFVFLIK